MNSIEKRNNLSFDAAKADLVRDGNEFLRRLAPRKPIALPINPHEVAQWEEMMSALNLSNEHIRGMADFLKCRQDPFNAGPAHDKGRVTVWVYASGVHSTNIGHLKALRLIVETLRITSQDKSRGDRCLVCPYLNKRLEFPPPKAAVAGIISSSSVALGSTVLPDLYPELDHVIPGLRVANKTNLSPIRITSKLGNRLRGHIPWKWWATSLTKADIGKANDERLLFIREHRTKPDREQIPPGTKAGSAMMR